MTAGERKYEDIINLPHHVSERHPRMSALDRAAQFSPFAALTGHEDAIQETGRLTEEFAEPDEEQKALMDQRLRYIKSVLEHGVLPDQNPLVEFVYFRPDEKKSGGAYRRISRRVQKIDEYRHRIYFDDGDFLQMEHLIAIEGEFFGGFYDGLKG